MAIYFMYGVHCSKEGAETTDTQEFLLQYDSTGPSGGKRTRRPVSPSSDEGPLNTSSETEGEDEGFLSNVVTTDEEKSPVHQAQMKRDAEAGRS